MKNKLTERLVELRIEKGFDSTRKAAKAMNLAYQTYWAYENGTRMPAIDILMDIAEFYGVTVDYLIGFTNKKNVEEGKYITVDELKNQFPEIADKLDELGAQFLKVYGKPTEKELLQMVKDHLAEKAGDSDR